MTDFKQENLLNLLGNFKKNRNQVYKILVGSEHEAIRSLLNDICKSMDKSSFRLNEIVESRLKGISDGINDELSDRLDNVNIDRVVENIRTDYGTIKNHGVIFGYYPEKEYQDASFYLKEIGDDLETNLTKFKKTMEKTNPTKFKKTEKKEKEQHGS
jgi:hypothetical protein